MVEIPEDIKEKATAAFSEAMSFNTDYESEEVVARAILAERKRCVDACLKLAEHQKGRGQLQEAFLSNFIAQQLSSGAHLM